MNDSENLPDGIKQIHHTLSTYIRQRQDALHVRRVLAAHLNSNVNAGESILTPISSSLPEPTSDVKQGLGFPGVQHEYLRSLHANLKAQRDFAILSTQHDETESHSEMRARTQDKVTSKEVSLQAFLVLEKRRQRQERFRIIQDTVDQLAQKPAATQAYLDPKSSEVLRDTGSLPPVPPSVIAPTEYHQDSERIELKSLVNRLEKSVLRAQLLLKKEQKLLAKVRGGTTTSTDQQEQGSRQQALGTTRNELINWIEMELGKAGDSTPATEGQGLSMPEHEEKEYIDSQLVSIKQIYERYLDIRKRLIVAATGDLTTPLPTDVGTEDSSGILIEENPNNSSNITNAPTYPYLEDLVLISNEQKSTIQQRSYLTSSLTRQHKEAGKDLDKLVDESHLLPAYPMQSITTSQGKRLGDPISFEEDISNSDKPSSSSRAKAWVFAAESSSIATKEAVLERLEDGESALTEAYKTLNDLQTLLGCVPEGQGVERDVPFGRQKLGISNIGGVWSTLDGNLGVIRTDDLMSD
ncbi:hypothetical protein SS1G_04433 [Sclerotinia sclerotiorum 1980 UF-70]|uniref:Uncharacterized protein n=2 Tax=Sclerotinia sclerotiorum (strain ATCC 18683 / 1980 / Ss-1) TaxID=665079 RepID=A7EGJ2_SCLS1|nr:hypothetical protein SS1G_04433 [Sclerotinia sclerotiorum 1980 UF-70]APA06915.1 hypothetical protein sscle_02g016850 [Sclerotinia sclerotiorum 1980 UF-70]EDO01958.1 hypothetical protein SS1G_04433 [Sclerotinia sclerotiorum 1980 UF-70]